MARAGDSRLAAGWTPAKSFLAAACSNHKFSAGNDCKGGRKTGQSAGCGSFADLPKSLMRVK